MCSAKYQPLAIRSRSYCAWHIVFQRETAYQSVLSVGKRTPFELSCPRWPSKTKFTVMHLVSSSFEATSIQQYDPAMQIFPRMSSFKYEEPYQRQDGRPSFSRMLPARSCVCYADAGLIVT